MDRVDLITWTVTIAAGGWIAPDIRPGGRADLEPRTACTVCGAITNSPDKRCPKHPRQRSPSSKATGTRAHRRRRAEMLKTAERICGICLKPIESDDELDAHHVNPVATHGPDGPLAPTHADCNRRKGAG